MNQAEAAESLGCSTATVSRIVSGDRSPGRELMYRIQEVLRWAVAAQVDELRAGTYANTFKDKMDRVAARRRA